MVGRLLCPTHWCRRLLEEHHRTGFKRCILSGQAKEYVLGAGAEVHGGAPVATFVNC